MTDTPVMMKDGMARPTGRDVLGWVNRGEVLMAVGVIAINVPQVCGNGYPVIVELLKGNYLAVTIVGLVGSATEAAERSACTAWDLPAGRRAERRAPISVTRPSRRSTDCPA